MLAAKLFPRLEERIKQEAGKADFSQNSHISMYSAV
jgi:hypothetical protein